MKGRKKESPSGQVMRKGEETGNPKACWECGTKNMKGLGDELSIGLEEPGLCPEPRRKHKTWQWNVLVLVSTFVFGGQCIHI